MQYARVIAGVIGGYVVIALIVIAGTWIAAEALVGAGGELTMTYLTANLVISFLAALVGGFVAGLVAGQLRLWAIAILALLVLVAGLLMEGSGTEPGWYPLLLPILGAAGVAAGGWLGGSSRNNPAIL